MSDTLVTLATSAVIAVAVAAFARHRGWSIALPLIAAGVLVGFVPVGPDAPPDPEIILIAVLAPLVFGEALGSSYLDLRKVSRPVLALAVGLVVVSTLTVGAVGALVAGIPLAMAFALGAVLAPTDAVAVSAVARRAGLPRRLVSILEGESLVNDGTGLTALSVALAAAAAGTVTVLQVSGFFLVAVLVGVAMGLGGGAVLAWVLRRSNDLVAANALVLVAPFVLYLVAEELDGSGILAVVVAGLVIAHSLNNSAGHTGRVQSAIVWRHITFVLQALAFFLVGLELLDTLRDLPLDDRAILAPLVAAVVATILVTRAVFVLGLSSVVGALRGRTPGQGPWRGFVVVAWAGARGPVSGMAAFSIPVAFAAGEVVPDRSLILATTFCVILVTLLLSLTLAPLARALHVEPDDDEETLRRVETVLARAALERLADIEGEAEAAGRPLPSSVIDQLRADAERRLARQDEEAGATSEDAQAAVDAARAMLRAEQEELLRMRDEEGLPESIVRPLLRQLDVRDQALRGGAK